MNQHPEPGSPWARLCPDAWPREWLDASGKLPPGFARPADPREADLITGRVTETAFLAATGRRCGVRPGVSRSSSAPSGTTARRKPNPVVVKVLGYRRFFDNLSELVPPLSAGAVAVWSWLWTCAKKGRARCSARKLARRFGVTKSTAARWLAELTAAGFVLVEERGRTGQSPSLVLVRASASQTHRSRPARGPEASR